MFAERLRIGQQNTGQVAPHVLADTDTLAG